MPRYYFNFRDETGLSKDPEGEDLSGLSAAQDEAVWAAKALVSDAIAAGRPVAWDDLFQVTDEDGKVLFSLSLREAAERADGKGDTASLSRS